MLSPTIDTVTSLEPLIPLGSHSLFEKLWRSAAETALQETLTETGCTSEEREEAYEALDLVADGLTLFLKEAKNLAWIHMPLSQREALVKQLKERPQIQQRSEEWFQQFGKVLTASEFSAIFPSTKKRLDLVSSKCKPKDGIVFRHACPTDEMNAVAWGVRFEPVVKQILEHVDGSVLYEPGRLGHPTNLHLAASPDAVIESSRDPRQVGRLVEIKCPYSRKIGGEIPSDYWIQMQIQLEVTGVDECEYVECEILSRKPHQGAVDLSGTLLQGCVYLLKQRVAEGAPYEMNYLYGAVGSTQCPPIPEGFDVVETIPWGLKAWHREVVSRDTVWYEATKPWQEAFWRDVERLRNGEQLEGVKPTACLITDD